MFSRSPLRCVASSAADSCGPKISEVLNPAGSSDRTRTTESASPPARCDQVDQPQATPVRERAPAFDAGDRQATPRARPAPPPRHSDEPERTRPAHARGARPDRPRSSAPRPVRPSGSPARPADPGRGCRIASRPSRSQRLEGLSDGGDQRPRRAPRPVSTRARLDGSAPASAAAAS